MADKLKIALCDDESESLAILHAYLLQMLAKQIDDVDILLFRDCDSLLANYPNELDVLFLDIAMHGTDGMTAAKQIRTRDKQVQIIFITNMPQFAIEGYKVHAFGYLLKPLSYESFYLELMELFQQIFSKRKQRLIVKEHSNTRMLKLSEIQYIETDNRKLCIHAKAKMYSYNSTMSELENTLIPHGFIRCHHAYLVNMAFVNSIGNAELELDSGQKIPVSRNKRASCLQALNRYMGAEL